LSVVPVPVTEPPVPTPATNASRRPSVASKISTAVVRLWTSTLAGLSNWAGIQELGVSLTICCALAIAPFIPFGPGVSTRVAPKARRTRRRSAVMVSGIVKIAW
jgi:hypothetical protein